MDQHNFCVYSSNYNLYGDMSDRVMSVIKEYANDVEVYSIDESFVDFSNVPDEKLVESLRFIKDEIYRKTGIPVSIGVGPNKTLAKLTSFFAKQSTGYNGVCSYWDLDNIKYKFYDIDIEEVWGIGRKWAKKLKSLEVHTVGQFLNMSDKLVRQLMNVNGLKTKLELNGLYCYQIQSIDRIKKNIASTRSFGQDVSEFNQVAEAMYNYIVNGVKKLNENNVIANKVSIFVMGNIHKGQNHYSSKQFTLQKPTNAVDDIWGQVYPQLRKLYNTKKNYKKCGIIFNELTPENYIQTTLFAEPIQTIFVPVNKEKKWELRRDFITKKYTTSWEDIPEVFV